MTYKTYKKIFAFLAIALLLFAGAYFVLGYGVSGPAAAPNLDNQGLVGYWNMEEGTGQTVYDRSGNGNNGTLGGTSAVEKSDPVFTSGYSSAGPGGTALKFDGKDDYVKILNSSSINLNGDITVGAWVYPRRWDAYYAFISKQYATINASQYKLIMGPTSSWGFSWYNGSVWKTYTGGNLPLNEWSYLICTAGNSKVSCYRNGQLSHETTGITIDIQQTAGDLYIGSIGTVGYWTNADIDEVRIYNRALSADEIRMHYNQKKPIAEWKMDEGSGINVKDASFNHTDGTLNLGSGGNTTVANAWVSGKYGSAISFDGTDDYVNAGNGTSLNVTGAITVEAWVKGSNSNGVNKGIIDKSIISGDKRSFRIVTGSIDASKTSVFFSSDGGVINAKYYQSSTTVFDNTWHHVATTFSSNTVYIYVDGVLDTNPTKTTDATVNTLYSTTANVIFGALDSSNRINFFNGSIDDPRIYSYARTSDEILADYTDGQAAHLGKNNQRDDGLVGYWNMEEGTGQTVYDRSGNGNNGTLGGTSAVEKSDPVFTSGYSSSGPGGTALKFDGVNDYVDAGNGASLNITNAITIEAWVKPVALGGSQGIVGKNYGANPHWALWSYNSYLLWEVANASATSQTQTPGPDFENNKWYHVVVVQDGTSVSIYVNNVLKKTDTLTINIANANNNNALNIGRLGTAGYYFSGSIDEVRIYNRALSADEIRMHYNQKKPIAEWKMDEGSGTAVKDASFNHNDGTLNLGALGNTTVANAWVSGKYGSAISFDGVDDYIELGNPSSFPDGTSSRTICAWIKPNTLSAPTGPYIFFYGTRANNQAMYIGQTDTGRVYGGAWASDIYSSNNFLSVGVWSFVCLTHDGTSATLYGNGQTLGSISSSSWNLVRSIAQIDVDYQGNHKFNGSIDDPRVYNYARSASEILADYTDGQATHLGKNNQRDDGLVGYWNMEEGTGQTVYDRSGNGNNGTLGGTSAVEKSDPVFTSGYSSSGPGGTALKFDGVNDYVDAGNGASLNITGDITVEAWVKRNSFGTPQTIVDKQKTTDDYSEPYRLIFENDNSLRFQLGGGGATWNALTFGTITDSNWNHIVVTLSGTTAKAYLNGNQFGNSATFSGTRQSSGLSFLIGKQNAGYYFNGSIDEVRIYNRALSADEIRQHYNQKKPIAEWKMDEGSGTAVKDASFNHNDGTLNLGTLGNTTVANAWVQGKYGSALSFDGTDDYVGFGTKPSLSGTTDFTIGLWIKTTNDGVSNGKNGMTLIAQRDIAYDGEYIVNIGKNYDGGDPHPGQIMFVVYNAGFQWTIWSNSRVDDGNWHFLTLVRNGANGYIYIDGKMDNSATGPILSLVSTLATNIGKDANYNARFFNGSIDDPRIYNYARSASEILTDYNDGLAAHLR